MTAPTPKHNAPKPKAMTEIIKYIASRLVLSAAINVRAATAHRTRPDRSTNTMTICLPVNWKPCAAVGYTQTTSFIQRLTRMALNVNRTGPE